MASVLSFLGPVGPMELTIIFLMVLLLFGAKKLPEFAKGLGKSLGEFKKAREDFENEITRAEQDLNEPEQAKPKPSEDA